MSRRRRAAGFLAIAMVCAAAAATLASEQAGRSERRLGPLVPVLVATRDLPARRAIDQSAARRGLAVRRVPERFAPPGAMRDPAEAIGRAPQVALPAGSYLLAAQLRAPRPPTDRSRARLDGGRRPLELVVGGAASLARGSAGSRVDVVVTEERGVSGVARTRIAVEDVELLDISTTAGEAADETTPSPGGTWRATLAVTRSQALRLIDAESHARQLRLLPR